MAIRAYYYNCVQMDKKKYQYTMQKFNQVITVEVPVDSIAQQLLSQFKEDSLHKELIVETIIGRALSGRDSKMLSKIYNSINGFNVEIDVKVGQIIKAHNHRAYSYVIGKDTSDSVDINQCRVINVNKYADDSLQVEYYILNRKHEPVLETKWVSHIDAIHLADTKTLEASNSVITK